MGGVYTFHFWYIVLRYTHVFIYMRLPIYILYFTIIIVCSRDRTAEPRCPETNVMVKNHAGLVGVALHGLIPQLLCSWHHHSTTPCSTSRRIFDEVYSASNNLFGWRSPTIVCNTRTQRRRCYETPGVEMHELTYTLYRYLLEIPRYRHRGIYTDTAFISLLRLNSRIA